METKKVLYVHGLASGKCGRTSRLLQKYLPGGYTVDAPEIPQDPNEARGFIRGICGGYDVVTGSSLGAFYSMQCPPQTRRVLINPVTYPGKQIGEKIGMGEQEYFSERNDGAKTFIIDEKFLNDLDALAYWRGSGRIDEEVRKVTRCLVSPDDELLGADNVKNCEDLFSPQYVTIIEGSHRVTEESIIKFVVPAIRELAEHC